ncbi:MAG: hypothetical protein P8M30_14060 [Planctomycetaceae bacterium]|jgi:hypothetical protein|nr:hypothetical protein [Planctomycetaceae bacterium]MDC0274064.1 hypothetical protein [Planctomycetaceae bacterium]MDC0307590.1 hypothetical protein [Planctomycetaceae bacterium]MDG2390428.1 hypothetical protein [Planctomycetaceae bacterium]
MHRLSNSKKSPIMQSPKLICLLVITMLVSSCPTGVSAQTGTTAPENGPRTYRSANFVVHSDVKPEEANELLKRLETMLGLISTYWGQRNRKTIECYVVDDLKNWPRGAIPPDAMDSILGQAGITIAQGLTNGRQFDMNAKVYAVSDAGVPQHEAVHAYCAQTFGTTGPVWYSEGMAEMGMYWKKGDSSVNANPIAIDYLKKSEPKSLNEIVNGQETTGDSWQNYAWRWALCHLLANNTNYQKRFRPLGLALLQKKGTSFEQVYGSMADEIIFEYLLFLENMQTGYRVDLCSWNWKARPRILKGVRPSKVDVEAKAGWQPTKAQLAKGEEYEFTTDGTWTILENGDSINADGNELGAGKLVGILFDDYKLSEEFEIGAYGKFTAPANGHLFVRCKDEWGIIADNDGEIEFQIRDADPDTKPLPMPGE